MSLLKQQTQISFYEEAVTMFEAAKKYYKNTKKAFAALQLSEVLYDGDIWYEETRKIEKEFQNNLFCVECDEMVSLNGEGIGRGIASLISFRDNYGYLFELALWAPDDVADSNWDMINNWLDVCWNNIKLGCSDETDGQYSGYESLTPKEIIDDIKDAYFDESTVDYPWIIGVSWGKDSSLVLKLVCHAIEQVPEEKRNRQIYVTTSDTGLEFPTVLGHMRKNTLDFQDYVTQEKLPIRMNWVNPTIDDRFWVLLIGKGYLPPKGGPVNRYCTDRLKIKPNRYFIQSVARNPNKAILILGTRYGESTARDISMRRWSGDGRYGNSVYPGTISYSPIKLLSTGDVWQGLAEGGFPWGDGFSQLEDLYKNGTDHGEDLLAGARFGCCCCTVVRQDQTLNNLIINGHWYLQPLKEFRELVMGIEKRIDFREPYLRDRRTAKRCTRKPAMINKMKDPSKAILGGINLAGRMFLLDQLLKAQEKVLSGMKKCGIEVVGGYEVITKDEIQRIKSWWGHLDSYTEVGFVPDEVVPKIVNNQLAIF